MHVSCLPCFATCLPQLTFLYLITAIIQGEEYKHLKSTLQVLNRLTSLTVTPGEKLTTGCFTGSNPIELIVSLCSILLLALYPAPCLHIASNLFLKLHFPARSSDITRLNLSFANITLRRNVHTHIKRPSSRLEEAICERNSKMSMKLQESMNANVLEDTNTRPSQYKSWAVEVHLQTLGTDKVNLGTTP